ncbi:hypothetical protein [Actinomadura rugatobispora]|uniref:Uncharacterized protein n=1 Tax=Actinomadura rugatobispora TaxID=1994 RepID=A0ABW1A3K1_9ACTN|nr:hypothetical protein GCM10010200_038310 [Actinomadura rugatobispora]
MADLYIDALATSVRSRPRLRPSAELPPRSMRRLMANMIARDRGVPAERVHVREPVPGDPADAADYGTTRRALDALGRPDDDQPLFVVRSGPVADPMTSPLAGTVHAVGWTGDDVGVTHLREHGGTQVFRLLTWAIPEDLGATVVIVDDPAFVAVEAEKPAFAAVAVRVARTGALRVVAAGEDLPGAEAAARDARVFSGTGACDAWLDLYAALSSGAVEPGEHVLLRTVGDERQGRLLLEAVRPRELRTSSAPIGE